MPPIHRQRLPSRKKGTIHLCGRIAALMETDKGKFPPPPGLMASFSTGFNAVASHVWVICMPVLLDLFLWLGPHLSLKNLVESALEQYRNLPDLSAISMPDFELVQQAWRTFAEHFNLFIFLRTFPVGINSLMSGNWPIDSPLEKVVAIQADSVLGVVGWGIILLLAGWILGGIYYLLVSNVTLHLPGKTSFSHSIKQTLMLSLIWLLIFIAAGAPILLAFSILTLISPLLAEIGLFLLALVAMWLVLPVFFSPHGIFANQQNAFKAIQDSLRMARFTLPTSGLFLLLYVLISQGLAFLWRSPAENSWLTLIGIAGHAFITTALLAASFIYYRDMNIWLQAVMDQIKSQTTIVKT
jgi:hypothetical protein